MNFLALPFAMLIAAPSLSPPRTEERVAPAPVAAPSLRAKAQPTKYERRIGFTIAGGVTAGVGGTMLVVGILGALGSVRCDVGPNFDSDPTDPTTYDEGGCDTVETSSGTVAAIGAALFLISIPLFAVGQIKMPVDKAKEAPRDRPPLNPQGRVVLSVASWGDGAGLQLNGSL